MSPKKAHQFDREKEFPNHFAAIKKALEAVTSDSDQSYEKVIKLIEKNIAVILARLHVPHITDTSSKNVDTNDFFKKLEQKLQQVVVVWNKNHSANSSVNLKVFVSGGVVRSLLAYIYQQLHLSVEGKKPLTQEEVEYARKIARLDTGVGSLAEFMQQEFVKPEFHLLRSSMLRDEEKLYNLFVLGVGSDLDVYYQLEQEIHPDKEPLKEYMLDDLQEQLNTTARDFINSVRLKLNIQDSSSAIQNSLLPVGDVKERRSQIARSMKQGGPSTDWLSFRLDSEPGAKLVEPDHYPENFSERISILRDFIDGIYQYVGGDSEMQDVLAIRGLRALLELPFLAIKDVALIDMQLKSMDLRNLNDQARDQVAKLIRNSYFNAANNRAHREVNGILRILADNNLIPVFVDRSLIASDRIIEGDNIDLVSFCMMPIDEFLEQKCAKDDLDYVLYHGSDSPQTMLHIIRGGFISSNDLIGQGLSLYGSGLYTTKDISLAKANGTYFFALNLDNNPNIRICDLTNLTQDDLEILNVEVESSGYLDINELLSKRYKIDIVINEHVIIQNTNVFKHPTLNEIMQVMASEYISNLHSNSFIDSIEDWQSTNLTLTVCEAAKPIGDVLQMYRIIATSESRDLISIYRNIANAVEISVKKIIGRKIPQADLNSFMNAYSMLNTLHKFDFISDSKAEEIKQLIFAKISKYVPFHFKDITEAMFMRAIRISLESNLNSAIDRQIFIMIAQNPPARLSHTACELLAKWVADAKQLPEHLEPLVKIVSRFERSKPPPVPKRIDRS